MNIHFKGLFWKHRGDVAVITAFFKYVQTWMGLLEGKSVITVKLVYIIYWGIFWGEGYLYVLLLPWVGLGRFIGKFLMVLLSSECLRIQTGQELQVAWTWLELADEKEDPCVFWFVLVDFQGYSFSNLLSGM